MSIDNEELMMQLQRFAILSRRQRHIHKKHRMHEHGDAPQTHGPMDGPRGPEGPHGRHPHHPEGHRGNRDAFAFGEPGAHGYGNHKCHGGSGRHGQNRILAALVMQDGQSQKDLAYLLGIRPQSLSEALAKLEESGMIERRHNDEDKRVINVFLTEGGRVRAAKVAEDRKQSANDVFATLTDEERDQLAAIMDKLIAHLEEELPAREPEE